VTSTGTVILNHPEGSEVWVDNQFVGNVPAILKPSAQTHLIAVKRNGHADWVKSICVLQDSEVRLMPVFE
jgi:hypothetical protein